MSKSIRSSLKHVGPPRGARNHLRLEMHECEPLRLQSRRPMDSARQAENYRVSTIVSDLAAPMQQQGCPLPAQRDDLWSPGRRSFRGTRRARMTVRKGIGLRDVVLTPVGRSWRPAGFVL